MSAHTPLSSFAKDGKKLFNAYGKVIDAPDAAAQVIQFFMRLPKRGDEFDMRSNIVDVMADVGHYLNSQGLPVAEIIHEGRRFDLSEPPPPALVDDREVAVRFYGEMIRHLDTLGFDVDAALWITHEHIGTEQYQEKHGVTF